MKNLLNILILLLLIQECSSPSSKHKEIIGYYPSFRFMEQREIENPNLIPFQKLTIINYAFFAPDSSGIIKGLDPQADSILLAENSRQSIISLAHKHGIKVLLSIGGWEDSNTFSCIAAEPPKTAKFASECIRVIKQCGFDGIDIDWEYPCYRPHNGSAADKENFTSFLSVIRDSLNTLKSNYYLLTAALPATKEHISKIEIKKVSKIVDFLNLMTYDYNGSWEEISNHNSPLYAPEKGNPDLCIDSTVKLLVSSYQIPSCKINIGIPFYGHAYANCKDIFMPHSGADTTVFKEEFGAVYRNIINKTHLFKRHWDKKARVPYFTGKDIDIFVSYDDTQSIEEKCNYVLKKKLRGVIIWEVTGAIMKDGSTPLLDVIYNKLKAD